MHMHRVFYLHLHRLVLLRFLFFFFPVITFCHIVVFNYEYYVSILPYFLLRICPYTNVPSSTPAIP